MNRFTINPDKLITTGLERLTFDPKKVILVMDRDEVEEYSQTAMRTISFKYVDEEVALKMFDLGYSHGWNKTGVSLAYTRSMVDGLHLTKTVSTTLRKSPKGGFTKKSLDLHQERVANMGKYDLEFAIGQFKVAFDHFNNWYVDEQTSRTVSRFSNVSNWSYEDETEITDLNKEIQEMSLKLKELAQKRFDRMCELLVKSIESKELEVNEDFVEPIINAVNDKRKQGYVRPFPG